MRIKRFFAADMRQAIRQVRNDQGQEAVILSSRAVDGGIEIISASGYDQKLILDMAQRVNTEANKITSKEPLTKFPVSELTERQPKSEQDPSNVEVTQQSRDSHQDQIAPQLVAPNDHSLHALQRELASMRGLVQDQLSHLSWDNYNRNQPTKAHYVRRLLRLGFSEKVAHRIVDAIEEVGEPAKSWRELLQHVARHIPVTDDDIVRTGGTIVLAGPTGVGKTTTLAKFAARFALRNGSEQVAMVTTDNIRIGAPKQIQTYGHILCMPVFMTTQEDLGRILDKLSDKKLILIDTAGMSPRDPHGFARLDALSNAAILKTYLVLSANTQRTVLNEVIRNFERLVIKGCILTKLDEAVSLGDALSEIIQHRLPLAYVSDGQRIPEDLHPAHIADLLERASMLVQRFEKAAAEESPALPTLMQKSKEMIADVFV